MPAQHTTVIRQRSRTVAVGVMLGLVAASTLSAAALGASPPTALFGPNLIVNGDAETGIGSPTSDGVVVAVPGWTTSGNFTVVEYETLPDVPDSFPTATGPGPVDRGTNLFVGGPANAISSASQLIGVAAAAKLIDSNLVTYEVAGWFGGFASQDDNAVLRISFQRANGLEVDAEQIGPVLAADRGDVTGLLPRYGSGTVPAGTRRIFVELTMTKDATFFYNDGYADNVSLQLASLFGSNVIRNAGAELGDSSPDGFDVVAVPGWTTDGPFTVARYGGEGLPSPTDPGPLNRGTALFAGGPDTSFSGAEQTIDVAAGARLIDTGLVPFTLSGHLGGFTDQDDFAEVAIEFRSSGGLLGSAVIGPVTAEDRVNQTGLLVRSTAGTVPAGTRWIVVIVEMTRDPSVGTYDDGYADDLRLVLGM